MHMRNPTMPQVSFVGAGPGDPSLLTVKAKQVIETADVILYDYLVHPSCLLIAKNDVIFDCVGKKKGAHSKTQDAINALILSYTQKGHRVLRLKGGDPSVFGRLGEEMRWCNDHDISYQVIPGVSSATAAPIYAGIPVTHRDSSRSVAFLTGTLKTGGSASKEQIPDADTIVILMGVSHLKTLVDELKKRPRFTGATPIAIISHGTMPKQRTLVSTLDKVLDDIQGAKIESPSLCVVGEVVTCQKTLDWQQNRRPDAPRILWYRTKDSDPSVHNALLALGYDSIWVPSCDFNALTPDLTEMKASADQITDIVFTSPRTVSYLAAVLLKQNLDFRLFKNAKITSIGSSTTSRLADYGLKPDQEPLAHNSKGICDLFNGNLEDKLICLPGAKEAARAIDAHCKKQGATVIAVDVYEKKWLEHHLTLVRPQDQDVVIVGSTQIAQKIKDANLIQEQDLRVVSLGNEAAAVFQNHPTINTVVLNTLNVAEVAMLLGA